MFDVALQMRFWRNLSDAMTHGTEAAFAAAAVWQKEMLAATQQPSRTPAISKPAVAPFPFWPMGFAGNASTRRWANFYGEAMTALGPNGPYAQMAKTFAPYFPWPVMTWAYMQTPLTAMFMSSGMPYTVAAPSAKASTCAMDAADAAREQMEKVYSAYRSDGGHAAAQLVMLPWTLASSFMTAAQTNAPSSSKIH